MRKTLYITAFLLSLSGVAHAQLVPLTVSGTEGYIIDTNGNGIPEPGTDGLLRFSYDVALSVLVVTTEGTDQDSTRIFQMSAFGATMLAQAIEIGQYPPTGAAQITSTRSPDQFVDFFADLFMPNSSPAAAVINKLLGGQ